MINFEDLVSKNQELTFKYLRRNKEKLDFYTEEGLYNNLALLFSGQCPYTIKVIGFEGTNDFISRFRREFSGSILKQIKDISDYMDMINHIRSTYKGLYRIDNRDYPIDILYEILLTCIIFRDYSFSNANCIFKFYEDRAEFVTAGSVETCRNPKLLNVLKELKLYNDEKTYEGKVELVQTNNSFRFILPNSNYLKVDN